MKLASDFIVYEISGSRTGGYDPYDSAERADNVALLVERELQRLRWTLKVRMNSLYGKYIRTAFDNKPRQGVTSGP